MSTTELLWAIAPLIAIFAALQVFSRKRRKTKDYAESRAVKERLPGWVKIFELLGLAVLCYILATATSGIYDLLKGSSWSLDGPIGAADMYIMLGIGLIVLPLALLGVNLLSWLIPAVRQANETASIGSDVSFRSASSGLIKFACISVSAGVLSLWLGAIAPWGH